MVQNVKTGIDYVFILRDLCSNRMLSIWCLGGI